MPGPPPARSCVRCVVRSGSRGGRLTRIGGRLALSGILAEQAEDVRAAYAGCFDLEPTATLDGWVRISGTRRR